MTTGSILILQVILCYITTATIYNYNEFSERIITYKSEQYVLKGFKNVIDKDFVIGVQLWTINI